MTISRRESLKWVFAAMAAAGSSELLSPQARAAAAAPATADPMVVAPWHPAATAPIRAPGYGTDPDLLAAKVPWPLTLGAEQRRLINHLGDLVLPADDRSPSAGSIDIAAFVDEWVSAPYPVQAADRQLVLPVLDWLDAQSRLDSGAPFIASPGATQTALLDRLTAVTVEAALAGPAEAFEKLEMLIVHGFYTSSVGRADLGLDDEVPMPGEYPGPSPEALAHLDQLLASLGLTRPRPT